MSAPASAIGELLAEIATGDANAPVFLQAARL